MDTNLSITSDNEVIMKFQNVSEAAGKTTVFHTIRK